MLYFCQIVLVMITKIKCWLSTIFSDFLIGLFNWLVRIEKANFKVYFDDVLLTNQTNGNCDAN